ncbi:high-affnity carbon uptake protein Hat/HatR [Pseudanabaena sp. lw0831]|uniref:WD40 domain-containing protein n=1 Tax=Pseudanabaena sp. lw0831 TaxID=1357935 RepID=UPI0019164BBB|nr:hypothetical protein [Pseudanabaena sp. lw0831]GBO52900.1 high-affnity carbon uptake protein Hat/HatR [Pseudanabaena sp. lw0831]
MSDLIDTNVDIITETIVDQNRDAMRRLERVVTRSQGFSLSIALCNYQVLQSRVLQDLRSQVAAQGLAETAIAILELEPEAKTLLTPIQELMKTVHHAPPEQKPKALMVLGLDAVKEIEAVLKSANRVREEFANCLEFPMILWLSDRTQDILTREASDLANWTTAGAIEFRLEPLELKMLVQASTEEMFDRFQDVRKRESIHTAIADRLQQFELKTAISELETQKIEIDEELRANLDFAFGCIAFAESQIDLAKELFQKSLATWQGNNQLKQAVCLLQLGMCNFNQAFGNRFDKELFYLASQQYLTESIAIFRQLERGDLVALYINFLTATMEELLSREALTPNPSLSGRGVGGEGLEALANEALALHQIYPNQLREAHDRAILSSVRLWQQDYASAKEFAETALALYHEGEILKLSNLIPSQRYAYCKQELWLARALEGLGDRQGAITRLEAVKSSWNHQYDAQIYVTVLRELRSLYTATGLYLEAFETKQHQRSVEQQYGLRAFIGAGTLNPKREANNPNIYTEIVNQSDSIAQEIEASGRMPDVQNLVDRIGQARFPLTIVHGDSGAGKSSILSGGVIPALRLRESFDGRKVLVLAVKTYKDWSGEIRRQLQDYFPNRAPDLDPIHHFKRNIDENYLTVLIFDQFEDFFFKKEDFRDRLPFYKFLKACLHTDFVRVVLSLREDYLHYLLECDRAVDLEKVENDILGKQVRYYLGDFTQAQARQVIETLTRRSQLRLEPELIDRLVTDLSGEQLRILPIELQVVGAQLESEIPPISTLQQYLALTGNTAENRGRKSSEVLVERWLENVVRDCGVANQDLAERVLYALTGNEEKRPQKTQAELASELLPSSAPLASQFWGGQDEVSKAPLAPQFWGGQENSSLSKSPSIGGFRGLDNITSEKGGEENLSLVLAVLVGSGLAFRVSSSPDDRFQLIHDYLVSFIRKKYVFGMAEELRMTKEQLRSALAEKEKELQRAEIAEIEALSISCEAYWLAHKELEAMIAGVKAANRILSPDMYDKVSNSTKSKAFTRLWEVIYGIREYNRFEGHSTRINSIAFAPNGKMIASGSYDNTIKLWSIEEKELITFKGHTAGITSVAFSPDGKMLASGSNDNTIKLWSIEGKELITIKGHSNKVLSIAFSPNGKMIASSSHDNTIKLWDLEGRELITFTENHDNAPVMFTSLTFSPNGKIIASAFDNTIKLWDLEDTTKAIIFKGHADLGFVNSVAFSPYFPLIASGSTDNTIKLWNLEGKELITLTGHSSWINSVIFSPNGDMIASGSLDKTIKLWNLEGEELMTFTDNSEIWDITFSPDSKMIASCNDDNEIKLWSLQGSKLNIFTGSNVNCVVFSPDCKTIAFNCRDEIKLKNLDSNNLLTLTEYFGSIRDLAFSPNGKMIVSGSNDNTIKLLNIESKKTVSFTGHSSWVKSVIFSPNGKMIASGSNDNTIKLWNLQGEELLTMNEHEDSVNSVIFSPDSALIISSSDDNTIRVWNLQGTQLLTINGQTNGIQSLALSPDGKVIASGGWLNTIKLWDLKGKELRTLTGHKGSINSLAFSPNGKVLASSSSDSTIKLWDLEGKGLRTLRGHYEISSMAFSSDGKMIVSSSFNGTIRLWKLEPDSAISEACDWLRPYLTNNPNVSESDRQLCEK